MRILCPVRLKKSGALAPAFWCANLLLAGVAAAGELVKFTVASEAMGEDRALIEELLRKHNPSDPPANAEEAEQYLTLDNLLVGRFDLNDDGAPELFVEYRHSSICGTAGCETDVFRKQEDQWIALTGLSTSGAVYVLDERIGGWRSLCAWESGMRWGKHPQTGGEGYLRFCISKQCEHELQEALTPVKLPPYNRGNSAPLCKDSPVSKKFG